ncbi:MAG: Glu/Leu/Phe/Val dehydrogenase [Bdellovibrionales bacterium]|nr:Glu/Leu/Phe/Val dehydrogenase [Bdellovibrionales bacterium]
MSVFNDIQSFGHERVSIFQDQPSGLVAIIALHDTVLGPAIGGCRMRPYASFDEALVDVLKLSEGMTYKNSLCGLNIGGGKSVIIADPRMKEGREDLFRAFGRCVQTFGGRYFTAEDMGTSVRDMEWILETTEYVVGGDQQHGGAGDPSPFTARGTFDGIRACLERRFGTSSYQGKKVAIQGVGHVGLFLAGHLHEAGAELIVTDTEPDRIDHVVKKFGAKAVGVDEIYSVECDVFAPCAIGGTLNSKTIGQLKCPIIAGAANNQIGDDETVKIIQERKIMYAPDFAINAGGVILCSDELEEGGYKESRVNERVSKIYNTVGSILDQAKESGEFTGDIAVKLAKERIERARAA